MSLTLTCCVQASAIEAFTKHCDAFAAMLLLLLLQVEVRPELWGRYAAVLNRLQGLLAHIATEPAQQQQQLHKQRPAQSAMPLSSSGRASTAPAVVDEGSRAGVPVLSSAGNRELLLGLLLGLLQQVEAAVTGKKAPGSGSSVAAAYAKGKEICLSVVKRYRRRLLGSSTPTASQQQQQRLSPGGGAAASSKPRQGPGSGQRVAFGLLLGGLVVGAPLMLAAGCGGRSMTAAGCSAVWKQRSVAAVVLHRL
jgi:hypothetical protein